MKKHILSIIIILLFFSCSKEKTNYRDESKKSINISRYILNSNNKNFTDEDKIKNLNQALYLIKNSVNSNKNRDYTYDLISKYYTFSDWEKYKEASNILLNNSLSANDEINIAKAYRSIGNYYNQQQILDSSYYFYSKAEKKYKNLNDIDGYSTILLKKGIIQYNINNYLASDLSLTKSYKLARQTKDGAKIYAILNQLSLVSIQLQEYDKALEYLNKALVILKENNLEYSEHRKSICLSNIGLVYLNLKEYKKAKKFYKLALDFDDLREDAPLLYSNIIDNLSFSKLQIKELNDLPDLFFESLKIREDLESKPNIVLSKIHLSKYFITIKDTIKAQKFANEALQLSKLNNEPFDVLVSLQQVSESDPQNASKYSDDYIRISDSLQLAERKNIDRFARIELETDEIRQERDDFEEKSQINLYYLFGTISFFIILIAIRTQRTRNRVLALKQAQQKANEDIYKLIISQQSKLQEGRELEKTRIARELHDGVLGRLFGLRLNLGGLNDSTEEAAIAMRLNYINELKLIEQDIREISHELSREKQVLINNFVSIINNLIDEQSKVQNADIKLKVQNTIDWDKLSNITKINLYRILQESLQNINKHAEAKNVKINFNMDKKNNLILKVVDDGKGFHVDKNKPGIGIKNILDRVNECKGVLDIISEVDKGTKLIITVPFVNNPQLN